MGSVRANATKGPGWYGDCLGIEFKISTGLPLRHQTSIEQILDRAESKVLGARFVTFDIMI
jgi:hypothetical protein